MLHQVTYNNASEPEDRVGLSKEKSLSFSTSLPSRKAMPPFEALRAFDAVARLGGVRKAAIGLDRDHAVISRHIRAIEAWTGSVLVERTPRGVVLTEEGRHYHAQIAAAIDMIADATSDLMKATEQQALNIWCMPAFAFHWLTGRLGEFEQAHPDNAIEVRPTDTSPDLIAKEADIDIRMIQQYGTPFRLPKGIRKLDLIELPLIILASPEYLSAKPRIEKPDDLLQHTLLHEDDYGSWKDWLITQGAKPEGDIGGPLLWQGHLTLDAARRGRGIALSNRMVAADDLETGRLVNITANNPYFDENLTTGVYALMARRDRWDMPALRRFRNWLRQAVSL